MNAEKLKKDINGAVEMIKSIHDDMVEGLITDSVPTEVQAQAVLLASRLALVTWFLEHVSEGVSA